MTVEEMLADLGLTIDPAKADAVKNWNTKFTALQTDSQAQLTDAQAKLADAQSLQRVIDDNIRNSGLTETNIAQLQANNAALTSALASRDAAIESIKAQGFSGLNIPDLPKVTPPSQNVDPVKQLTETIMKGFGQMGQTMNESNRYMRVFGQPIPEDPATLADRAATARLSIHDYVEQTYKVSAKEQEIAAATEQKSRDEYANKKLEEYKAAHPVTSGHPELGPGVPSNYPNIPAPRKGDTLREFSAKSPMEKIRDARDRVTKEVNSRMASA